jgi:hypothetical protein
LFADVVGTQLATRVRAFEVSEVVQHHECLLLLLSPQ